ncbi:MAG: LuxR family transcriptional regulator [Devosia sp.]|uniref:helix-turn-helix transcriptional regulator n=1 Tax=Devosia sp. TaxID=1871048 RepID=UPI00261AC641|nr:autoinducer binding domain-containing protein [Devosia sp.]MDB5528096.1 LuxR family transcriptional regulator [Devosia sp.]
MAQDWAAEMSACGDLAAVKAVFVAGIEPYGYTAGACGAFVPADRGPETHFFFQHWPETWIALYRSRSFHLADFSVSEARRRIAPFTWQDAKAQRQLTRPEQDLGETANQWGWTDGLSVPFHGPGGYLGLVTMAGGRRLTATERDTMHLLAFHAHERCRALAGVSALPVPTAPMTIRELECLRWVVAGKTDGETATIMGLSRETVKGHVDSARAKLGARTRPQAAARLVLAGLS